MFLSTISVNVTFLAPTPLCLRIKQGLHTCVNGIACFSFRSLRHGVSSSLIRKAQTLTMTYTRKLISNGHFRRHNRICSNVSEHITFTNFLAFLNALWYSTNETCKADRGIQFVKDKNGRYALTHHKRLFTQ
jgi:hypothetical protein